MLLILSVFHNNLRALLRNRTLLLLTLGFPWIASTVLQVALSGRSGAGASADYYVFMLTIFVFWFMLNMSAREIVRERQAVDWEIAAGLSPVAYLAGKSLYLLLIAVYLSLVLSASFYLKWMEWSSVGILLSRMLVSPPPIGKAFPKDSPEHKRQMIVDEANSVLCSAGHQDNTENCRTWSDLVFLRDRWHPHTTLTGVTPDLFAPGLPLVTDSVSLRDTYYRNTHRLLRQPPLRDRLMEQVKAFMALDYLLVIMMMSAGIAVSLGLFLSVTSRNIDSAVQTVPYITIIQILLNQNVFNASIDRGAASALIGTQSWSDWVHATHLEEKLSYFTFSRHLTALAEVTVLRSHDMPALSGLEFLRTVETWLILSACLIFLTLGWYRLRQTSLKR